MIRSLDKRFINFLKLIKIPRYHCFNVQPNIKHIATMMMRSTRRQFLNRAVLNQNKEIIYAEKRKPNDTILGLKQKGLCPGVIKLNGKGQQDEIDIVLPGGKMRSYSKHLNHGTQTVYIRVEDQQYRCVLHRVHRHTHDQFVIKAQLIQYKPGQPNELTLPIQWMNIYENPYIQRGGQFETVTQQVKIICYNEYYPLRFIIDVSFVCPERPYKIGDLANSFPPGILLHPDMDPARKILYLEREEAMSQVNRKKARDQYLEKLKTNNPKKAQGQTGGQPGGPGGPGGAGGAGGAGGSSTAKK